MIEADQSPQNPYPLFPFLWTLERRFVLSLSSFWAVPWMTTLEPVGSKSSVSLRKGATSQVGLWN